MGKDGPYVVVHGGVHKTATSYLQSILQRNAGRLAKSGVHYIHHREARKHYTYPCQLNGYEKLGLEFRSKVSDDDLAKRSRAFSPRSRPARASVSSCRTRTCRGIAANACGPAIFTSAGTR